ncbi:nucleic acid-binding protein [Parathielavia appendiculata]|uniref:Nucleic acid-binding protein n=1 Tax=Parathielavia appendiculata TaxID=2587402 RepID=A0AAN6Z624_9PEZI|nr:nucleic acid-binding protein [Parathielavia appendiculata]
MGKPKRAVLAAAQESLTPPGELTDTQFVARVVKAEGNSLYTCELPNGKPILVELEPKFRNTIFIRRGGYVLVDLASAEERAKTSRVMGEIINIVRDEKEWRKQPYWPKKFVKNTYGEDEDEDSNVGKMPPSDSEQE